MLNPLNRIINLFHNDNNNNRNNNNMNQNNIINNNNNNRSNNNNRNSNNNRNNNNNNNNNNNINNSNNNNNNNINNNNNNHNHNNSNNNNNNNRINNQNRMNRNNLRHYRALSPILRNNGDLQIFRFVGENRINRRRTGLTENEINRIPDDVYHSNFNYELKNCTICLENFKDGDNIKRLGCLHIFHKNCIIPWLKTKNFCPIDKHQINVNLNG